jgi:hypothetical protein
MVDIYTPAHLTFACTSVLRNHVYRQEITQTAGSAAFRWLHVQSIIFAIGLSSI